MTETLINKLNWAARILLMESSHPELFRGARRTALVIPA